jgi:hypothetical protein
MTIFHAPESSPPAEVLTTAAMRIALYSCAPVFVATLGEASLSAFPQLNSQEWLVAATFLGAMLSWVSLAPLIGATFWARRQEQLAAKSKLVLWAVVLGALGLTLVIPSRVINSKYYVWNAIGEPDSFVVDATHGRLSGGPRAGKFEREQTEGRTEPHNKRASIHSRGRVGPSPQSELTAV